MKKIFLTIFIILFTTSCATQQFRMSNKSAKSTPNYTSEQTFFVYGIGQTQDVNTAEICGGNHKVTEVTNSLSPLDVIIGIVQSVLIFVQVYSPRATSVTCE